MNATAALPVVGIDVAKSVFQLAVADGAWRVIEEHRLKVRFRHATHSGSSGSLARFAKYRASLYGFSVFMMSKISITRAHPISRLASAFE